MKVFASTKRGRPKRARAANDNAPDNGDDLGTHELQLKRAAVAQGADPQVAAHPLDLLLARGLIDAPAHRAAWRYAGLYRRVIGRTDVSYGRLYEGLSGDAGRGVGSPGDDEDLVTLQRGFRQAQAALRAEGAVVAGITERLVVFGAWPDWLLQPVTIAHRELGLLRRGLARLANSARGTRPANDNAVSQVKP